MKKILTVILSALFMVSAISFGGCGNKKTLIVPNDVSNQTRALLLLDSEGLIKLKEGVSIEKGIAISDIENKNGFDIIASNADMIPAQLKNSNDGTIVVVNGNYAISAKLKISDALAKEDAQSEAARTYANIIATRDDNKDDAKINALVTALMTQSVKEFIENKYNGAVMPSFVVSETEIAPSDSNVTITVGASATPHAEILNHVKPILAEKGYNLEIVTYNDYVLPNKALADKEIDANYFQHTPYLNQYNSANGKNLFAKALIHYEPMCIFGQNVESLNDYKIK